MERSIEIVASVLFALAILHTFSVGRFQYWAGLFKSGSVGENLFHLLGEVEVVFGFWAAVLLGFIFIKSGSEAMLSYLNSLNFTEPVFVFVIMSVCSTQPVLSFARNIIAAVARLLPLPPSVAFFSVLMVLGPLLGSLITEPAAMTVSALLLLERLFSAKVSMQFKYAALGLLFVNISIGGTLTHFAAPPVLMVAPRWGWGISEMFWQFGWKGAIACFLSTVMVTSVFYRELKTVPQPKQTAQKLPIWVTAMHLVFLGLIIAVSHHLILFMGLFLYFLGLVSVTKEYQTEVKLRESLLVGFFLGGLVVLGSLQHWWLEPLLKSLDTTQLYLGTAALTAVTDNAALTYLGSQVPGLSEASKYALLAGAVVGGGLTVVANAPNPAGYGILNSSFGRSGISPMLLFFAALPPTLIAGLCFWFL